MPPGAPSARSAAKARVASQTANTPNLEGSKKGSASTAHGPSKKQKTSSKKASTTISESNVPGVDDFRRIRGGRGELEVMTELPIDVLIEIFGHLEPYDLLCLSRASKGLRAILVGENTSSLWKKAYANLGKRDSDKNLPPPFPPRVNIRRYTNFLFGRGCMFCGAHSSPIVHWEGRARLCNRCAETQLMPRYFSHFEVQGLSATCYMTKSHIPRTKNPFISSRTSYAEQARYYMLKQEHDRHVRELKKCVGNEAKARYKETWTQYVQENIKFTKRLRAWLAIHKKDVIRERRYIRARRQVAITAKLRDAGYGPELATGRYRVQFLPGSCLTAPLTEEGWVKIKARIIGVYEWQRQETRKSNMTRNFQTRLQHLSHLITKSQEGSPSPWIYVPTPHVARSEPFATVMKEYAEDVSNTHLSVLLQKMDSLEARIPELSKVWRNEADHFLLGLLSGTNDPTVMSVDDAEEIDRKPLELATTFFKSHCSCAEPISYPRILMHACLRNRRIPDNDDEDDTPQEKGAPSDDEDGDEDETDGEQDHDSEEQDASTNGEPRNDPNEVYVPTVTADGVWRKMSSWSDALWNESDMIEIDDEAMGFARVIVQACGEDPGTLTAAAMNERDARVECMRCVPPPGKKTARRSRHVMTWKAAILHDIGYHFEEPPTAAGWKLVTDDEDLKQVHALENKLLPKEKKMKAFMPLDYCRHCDVQPTTPADGGDSVQEPSPAEIDVPGDEKGDDFEKIQVKRHICKGADAPMKAYPRPVKI